MKKERLIILVWLAYVLAWGLPVIKDGVTLPEGLPGWQAFRFAASPVWAYEDFESSSWPWHSKALSVLSAATNLVMLFSLPVFLQRARTWTRVMLWSSGLAFLLNAHWCIRIEDLKELRSGYFLWWWSFLALFVAFILVRRTARGAFALEAHVRPGNQIP